MVKLETSSFRMVVYHRESPVIPGVDVRTVSYHLGQIFASGELEEEATIRKFEIVQIEGERV